MDPILMIANRDGVPAEREALDAALGVIRAHTDVEVAQISNPGELDGVLHRAGTRRIVITGDDTSLHALVSALHRRNDLGKHQLGLIPVGPHTDFARAIGIPLDPTDAARSIVEGVRQPLDLLVDELGEIAVNGVQIGASAGCRKWQDKLGAIGVGKVNLGLVGLPFQALATVVNPPVLRVRVEVDDEVLIDVDQPVLMVAVDPVHESDRLEVSAWLASGGFARMGYVVDLVRGDHADRADLVHATGTKVSVLGGPFHCALDGSVHGPEKQRTWTVSPDAFSMTVPESAAHPRRHDRSTLHGQS